MKLRTKKTKQWITYYRDGGEARFLVSPMTESENADLLKICRKFGWEKGQRFEDTPDYQSFKSQKIKKTIRADNPFELLFANRYSSCPAIMQNNFRLRARLSFQRVNHNPEKPFQ